MIGGRHENSYGVDPWELWNNKDSCIHNRWSHIPKYGMKFKECTETDWKFPETGLGHTWSNIRNMVSENLKLQIVDIAWLEEISCHFEVGEKT